jgi:hypothetical protein
MIDGDEVLAEWDRSDLASVEGAEREYRRWLDQRYVAARSDDGAHCESLTGGRLPVDAAEVILTTAMGRRLNRSVRGRRRPTQTNRQRTSVVPIPKRSSGYSTGAGPIWGEDRCRRSLCWERGYAVGGGPVVASRRPRG